MATVSHHRILKATEFPGAGLRLGDTAVELGDAVARPGSCGGT